MVVARERNARDALIEAAWALLGEIGYDRTTVAAVLERSGLSKGAFYHHFESKSDLLDAVLDDVNAQLLAPIHRIVRDEELSAIGKLNLLMDISATYKARHMEALLHATRALQRPENHALRDRYQWRTVDAVAPLYAAIVRQGCADGVFDAPDPEATAEMMLLLGIGVREANMREMTGGVDGAELSARLGRRVKSWLWATERLLGAEPGSLDAPSQALLDRFEAAVRETMSDEARGPG